MNKEYRKFNEFSDVYIPPATEPGHFSNLPDVLVPTDYHEDDGDPLEKDVADLVHETKTPPATPPELEPGRAGCRIFREVKHYVAPIYADQEFQRIFTTKLILGNLLTYVPTILVMAVVMTNTEFDYSVISNPFIVVMVFVFACLAAGVYIYFVGLFRNPPMLYIALGIRTTLNTVLFCCGMLLVHISFLHIIAHPLETDGEHEEEELAVDSAAIAEALDHAPPYMAILIIILMVFVQCTICFMLMKYKYPVTDYRTPFVIYTTCHSTSAILVTIVLNNGFKNEPIGYDLFQVIAGCYIASLLLMRTPHFIGRLYDGKVCPLREGELYYAMIHFGL